MPRRLQELQARQGPPRRGVPLAATCRIGQPTEPQVLIEIDKRLVATFPLSTFDPPTLEKIRRGEICVELEPQELDSTRAITFLDVQKRAIFRDRVRIAETRWV